MLENVNVAALVNNPRIVFMQPRYGNHFGFYEGPLREALSCDSSYTYPAKVARVFFDCLVAQRERDSVADVS